MRNVMPDLSRRGKLPKIECQQGSISLYSTVLQSNWPPLVRCSLKTGRINAFKNVSIVASSCLVLGKITSFALNTKKIVSGQKIFSRKRSIVFNMFLPRIAELLASYWLLAYTALKNWSMQRNYQTFAIMPCSRVGFLTRRIQLYTGRAGTLTYFVLIN